MFMKNIPSGYVVLKNGNVYVESFDLFISYAPNGSEKRETKTHIEPIEKYVSQRQSDAYMCLSEMQKLLDISDFRFVKPFGLAPVMKKRIEKNRRVKSRLSLLIDDMQKTNSIKELDVIHKEIFKIIDNCDTIFFDEASISESYQYINGRNHKEFMPSGMPKSILKRAISSADMNPDIKDIFRKYINTAYEHLKDAIVKKEEAEKLLSGTKKQVEPISASEADLRLSKSNLSNLEDRLSSLKKRLEELKYQLSQITIRNIVLHATQTGERKVFEWDRELNGTIEVKKQETRYINGTDRERKQVVEEEKRIREEIKKVEKQIRELEISVSLQQDRVIEKESVHERKKAREKKRTLNGSEKRVIKNGKFRKPPVVTVRKNKSTNTIVVSRNNRDDEEFISHGR